MDGRDCERKNMLTFHTQQFLYMFSLQKKLQVRADKHLAGSGCGRFENLDPVKKVRIQNKIASSNLEIHTKIIYETIFFYYFKLGLNLFIWNFKWNKSQSNTKSIPLKLPKLKRMK